MSVYDRSVNPRTPNLWLRYAIMRELAARWGLASRTVREPAGTGLPVLYAGAFRGRRANGARALCSEVT